MTERRRFYALGGINAATYDVRTQTPAGELDFYVARARASGGPVLELGCGTGRISWPIARAGIPIVGLDIERAMLERAEAKRDQEPGAVASRARFVRGDMSDFSLDQQFPLVIIPFRAFQMLLTVEMEQQTLACVRRHLLPGGTLIIDVFDPRFDLLAEETFTPRREVPSMHDPATGNTISVTVVERTNDRVRQRAAERWLFREVRPDGTLVSEQEEVLELRWNFRYEMRHLFSLAGFVVEEELSDYFGAPPAYGKEQIWVVRRV